MADSRKGGYQIVEIGTGIVGMYDKLKSAYESNKPILVKKNGVTTFGNVTKDGNYFVANYIIDDTLYQDTISQLDAITDSSIDIGGNAGDIADIEDRLDKCTIDYTNAIDLTPYQSFANSYTVPSDGYVIGAIPSGSTTNVIAIGNSEGGSLGCIQGLSGYSATFSVFVRKGIKVCCHINVGTNNSARFVPVK